ncbi:uroporphyrin-III methyltransferase [Paenibacillus stellifer]|uniref:Uroporphyrinogen-III C-methyltransferase n=1 Tax=Paenibacillus stellifer TaxID=169760 RepID=A0A089M271_9BACL|nr:uroporphyrinogen-III C-methyltransferase [Paenibacillus stellifer]AIQ65593.1 uroporphyrin-III methyltransferase [Paenibacillus stellifer]
MKPGRISIVGAGPGDPELITVKAMRRIQDADIVLYDRLVSDELLEYAKPEARLIYCGKSPGSHSMTQREIEQTLIHHACLGRNVVRLKGGDPLVFGRGGEEVLAAAEAGVPWEVVPGITSAVGAAAAAGIPLTHRGIAASFAVVTGSRSSDAEEPVDWKRLADGVDTIAIYMGVGQLPRIQAELLRHGKQPSTPAALIENGTTARQRTVTGTLENIGQLAASLKIGNPAMIIIGEVVAVRERLASLEAAAKSMIG